MNSELYDSIMFFFTELYPKHFLNSSHAVLVYCNLCSYVFKNEAFLPSTKKL